MTMICCFFCILLLLIPRYKIGFLRILTLGALGWLSWLVKHPPLVQVMISGSWDIPALGGLPVQQGVCFSLSLCPSTLLVLAFFLTKINKEKNSNSQIPVGGNLSKPVRLIKRRKGVNFMFIKGDTKF